MRLSCFAATVVVFSACISLHATSIATATPLAPGGSVVPLPGSYSGTQLAATVFATSSAAVTQAVFADGNNPLCPNCLDFVIFVSNHNSAASAISVESVSSEDFTGFETEVAYSSTFAADSAPLFASRTDDGRQIAFSTAILPNTQGDALIIYTNATTFGPGNIDIGTSLQTIDPPAYAPTSATTPEPSGFILLGTGLIGPSLLGLAGRFKRHFHRLRCSDSYTK